ncbi:MAG: S8 family serine peptidase, partial [Deltaproteobacteria bacterium]
GGIQKPWGKFKEADKKWGAEPIASDMPSNNPNGLAAFSSRGPTPDGRLKPDVVAPGTNVLSARSHMPNSEKLWGEYNEHYLWSGGTSMATPLVSGSAALVRQ